MSSYIQQNPKPFLLLAIVVALCVMYKMRPPSVAPVPVKAATLSQADVHDDDTSHLIRGDEFPLERDGIIPELSARRDQL